MVEYLRNLPPDKFNITLGIGMKMDGLEVHVPRLPEYVKVVYLVENSALVHIRRERIEKKLPITKKIYDQGILNPIRKHLSSKVLKHLIEQNDVVIDFDATFYSQLQNCNKPIIGFYHFSIAENISRYHRHTMRQMKGMSRYNAIVLISDTMVEEGIKYFPNLANKFKRIYNGYNLEELRERGAAEPGIELQTPFIVAVERLEESQKDISTLIKAYSKAFREYKTQYQGMFPSLVIVGKGRDLNVLRDLAVGQGVEQMVHFTGFQKDAAPIISRSMALIHSSKYEGFGLVLAEAMILGKGVVSTDTPTGPAEVLDGGRAGYLLPVGDVQAMSKAILRLATDKEWVAELAERGSERATEFDIQKSVSELINLFPE